MLELCVTRRFEELTGLNGVEEIGLLCLLLNICINKKRVCLRVDVFHHDLEAVKAACLWDLNLSTESLKKILVDNSVRGSEERENVRNKVSLVIVESVVPVVKILGQIDFLCSPEGSLRFLVHLPDLTIISEESITLYA